MSDHTPVANPEYAAAMHELRKGSAAQPQESRNKRLRTKQAVLSHALKEES